MKKNSRFFDKITVKSLDCNIFVCGTIFAILILSLTKKGETLGFKKEKKAASLAFPGSFC